MSDSPFRHPIPDESLAGVGCKTVILRRMKVSYLAPPPLPPSSPPPPPPPSSPPPPPAPTAPTVGSGGSVFVPISNLSAPGYQGFAPPRGAVPVYTQECGYTFGVWSCGQILVGYMVPR